VATFGAAIFGSNTALLSGVFDVYLLLSHSMAHEGSRIAHGSSRSSLASINRVVVTKLVLQISAPILRRNPFSIDLNGCLLRLLARRADGLVRPGSDEVAV